MAQTTESTTQPESNSQLRGMVENKVSKPAGLLPKNTQQLVILGVAVVMVLIMWLTGGSKRAHTAPPPVLSAGVQAPNPATVEDFKQTIQQQQASARQPISPENLDRLRALGLAGDVPSGGVNIQPAEGGVPQPGGVLGGAASSEAPSSPDPVKEDKKKREYLSLFAPNVAFTYRKGQEAEQVVGTVAKVVSPSGEKDMQRQDMRGQPITTDQVPAGIAPFPMSFPSPQQKEPGTTTKPPNPNSVGAGAFNGFTGNRYVLFEGTYLETLLINRINGTFSGPVDCLVTTDVYSHDRQHLLIPAGTKVLGEAKKVEALGQQRLAVLFHRLIMPDGYSVSLDQFKALNQNGETALRDQVNNHYVQIFGASLAVGILGGIAEAGTGNALTNSPFDRVREGFGASIANSSINILDRFLNILPTVTIREGHRVKVYFSGDLLLPDYTQHTMQPNL
jgi:type IV secretion system protein TrbI